MFFESFLFDNSRRKSERVLLSIFFGLLILSTVYISLNAENFYHSNKLTASIFGDQKTEEIRLNSQDQSTATTNQTSSASTKGGEKTGSTSSSSSSSTTADSTGSSAPTSEDLSAFVAFYADSQSDSDADDSAHQTVVNNILATSANPVFHAGDLMEDGTEDSLNRFNNVTATLRNSRTFYSALGNNDRTVGDASTPSALYFANFNYPNNEQWYSVNIGNLHMIVMDSAFSASSASQLNWLTSDLQSSASQSRITGVMYHHPTFSSTVATILSENGADFVISGHTHTFAHSISGGVNYFVTSGQTSIGYFTAKVYSSYATISYYNSGNGLVEKTTVQNR